MLTATPRLRGFGTEIDMVLFDWKRILRTSNYIISDIETRVFEFEIFNEPNLCSGLAVFSWAQTIIIWNTADNIFFGKLLSYPSDFRSIGQLVGPATVKNFRTVRGLALHTLGDWPTSHQKIDFAICIFLQILIGSGKPKPRFDRFIIVPILLCFKSMHTSLVLKLCSNGLLWFPTKGT